MKKFEKDENDCYINDNIPQVDYYLSVSKNLLFKFLMFLNYIKNYSTNQQFSTTWLKDTKTIIKYRSQIISVLMEYFYDNPIEPSSRLTQNPLEIYVENQAPTTGEMNKKKILVYSVIVTTIFKISKPVGHKKESPYYSDKHKFHCVKIQTIVNITDGKPNHILNEIFPGSTHDFEISKNFDFIEDYQLIENELILGDLGYQGDQKKFLCANIRGGQNGENLSPMDKKITSFLSSYRVIVEKFYGRVKQELGIFSGKYRACLDEFQEIIIIIINLVTILFDYAPLKKEFQIIKENFNKSN